MFDRSILHWRRKIAITGGWGAQWIMGNRSTTIGNYRRGIIQGGARAPGAPLVPPLMSFFSLCIAPFAKLTSLPSTQRYPDYNILHIHSHVHVYTIASTHFESTFSLFVVNGHDVIQIKLRIALKAPAKKLLSKLYTIDTYFLDHVHVG